MSRVIQLARIVRRSWLLTASPKSARVAALLVFLAPIGAEAESGREASPSTPATSKRGEPSTSSLSPRPQGASTSPRAASPSNPGAAEKQTERRPQIASTSQTLATHVVLKPTSSTSTDLIDPIARAKQRIAECQARYREVDDYSCTFYKRERIEGRLTPLHVMTMKVRTRPHSIYLKFQQPNQGREAIFVEGRNEGRVLAHDVGITKFLAGTLSLDPNGARAMEDCRHPITEAGIGMLLETVSKRWAAELKPGESVVHHRENLEIGPHSCSMIESIHPDRRPEFLFHKVRVFIDDQLGLPIRFEAYDWPSSKGHEPELIEEYTYYQLRLNVGLQEPDFDPANESYSFGRF